MQVALKRSDLTPPLWLLGLGVVVLIWLVLRLFIFPAPIYSGDEYAYLKQGLTFADPGLAKLRDPFLQDVGNVGYLKFVHTVGRVTPYPLFAIGFLQIIAYLAAVGCVWFCSVKMLPKAHVAWPPALMLLMPFATYTGAIMPEIMLGAGFWLLNLCVCLSPPTRKGLLQLAAGAGVITAILLTIKINAWAIVAATVLWLLIAPFFGAASRGYKIGTALLVVSVFLAMLLAVRAGLLGWLQLGPESGGSFYANFAKSIADPQFWLDQSGAFVQLLGLHIHILLILFAPVAVLLALQLRRKSPRLASPDYFWIFVLIIHLAMVALFTVSAGLKNDFEALRLHERYYWYLLPALFIMTLKAWAVLSSQARRAAAAISLFSLSLFLSVGETTVKLYPWDAADLFGFYAKANQSWGWQIPLPFLWPTLIAICAFGAVITLLRPLQAQRIWLITIISTLSISYIGCLGWQRETILNAQPYYRAGQAVAAITEDKPIIVVGSERYGVVSYFLVGLKTVPYVRQPVDKAIDPAAIPADAAYLAVVTKDGYQFKGTVAPQVIGPITLYQLPIR